MRKSKQTPVVSVVMGSDSDFAVMEEAVKVLDSFGISCEVFLTSAHRSPKRTTSFAEGAAARGVRVLIVWAGAAAHLAGVIAAHTPLPVIGVPLDATSLRGMDALLATVQMPGGIPVAAMAIGKAGAKNAALLAVRILALAEESLGEKLRSYHEDIIREIEKKQKNLPCRK